MWLAGSLNIDYHIIQIYLKKDIKLFNKDFIGIGLKTDWYIVKAN